MTRKVAALLFFSGFCALIYQTVWLRQFRLIFGASTYATGAVLAIFMGGLGLGSALLGKRADGNEKPLGYYAKLELLISIAAGLSPLLLWIAAKVYFSSGGSPQLGTAGATVLRLLLALLVLGPVTFLMGGTLPAAARAVSTSEDAGRRAVALLYGVNTLGAVAGTLLSTFVLLEWMGNRSTLLLAVGVNLLVGAIALSINKETAPVEPEPVRDERAASRGAVPIYIAAAVTGFAFLLMELVWYRMLSPILGGTTFMFGLILAVALFGIGLGGAAYAVFRRGQATIGAFAIISALEALAIVIPFALGDRVAILANVLRNLGVLGFGGHITGWTIITFFVVFPAAFLSGIQFPLLISLSGRGREHVGRQIGNAYAWNTAGAIAGSLAGGFGVIPLLSAPVTWAAVAFLLALLAVAAALLAMREQQAAFAAVTFVIAVIAVGLTLAPGPTALWRHSGVAGGSHVDPRSKNELYDWMYRSRRVVVWERDGRESSVALVAQNDLAFVINGKADGAAIGDAGMQVMAGLIPAALHGEPKTAMVVGLGTGSTAGWLAGVPSIQRVDVAEMEPVVLDVARACEQVNNDAMTHPKVRTTIADAREMLLASGEKYDVIMSEPSNPYRAGIASLFTRDFYEAAAERLAPRGYFAQWLQMYAIQSETVQTVYATLNEVFPHVQTWRTTSGDMVLVASKEPIVIDANALRARLATEPYRSAMFYVWRADSLEAFLSHHVANEYFARAAADQAPAVNTDDRNAIEFDVARALHERADVARQITEPARRTRTTRPASIRGAVDWNAVEQHAAEKIGPAVRARDAMKLAMAGDMRAEALGRAIGNSMPIEGYVILAELRFRHNQHDSAAALLARAFELHRRLPWGDFEIEKRAFELALAIGNSTPERARRMYEALSRPFAAASWEDLRRSSMIHLAYRGEGCGRHTLGALQAVEPNPFWDGATLNIRARCYEQAGLYALRERAQSDLQTFVENEAMPIVRPRSPQAPRGSF
jgi:spermidine synthase